MDCCNYIFMRTSIPCLPAFHPYDCCSSLERKDRRLPLRHLPQRLEVAQVMLVKVGGPASDPVVTER